jgi:putative FmdB family regulatory protein
MPIYEYRCSACGYVEDVMQKMSDAPLSACPKCGKDTFAKQLSAAGFQLKGSGWYATDFKGSPAKTPSKEESAPAATPCGANCACH